MQELTTKTTNTTYKLNYNSTAPINNEHNKPNGATSNVGRQLPAPEVAITSKVNSSYPKNQNQNLRRDTQNSMACFKKFFSRVAGVVVGTARAALNFLWSPVTAGKYLIVAIVQAYRGEGARALAALALAIFAPIWGPMDGAGKVYKRFAEWGDGNRGLTEDNNSDRNKLEGWKAYAKDGVIDPKDQKALNFLPFYVFYAIACNS